MTVEEQPQPLDLQLLDLLAPEDADRSLIAHALCEALDIDLSETTIACLDVFARRRTMAGERWPELADGAAIIETFVVGIALGYGLAQSRCDCERLT